MNQNVAVGYRKDHTDNLRVKGIRQSTIYSELAQARIPNVMADNELKHKIRYFWYLSTKLYGISPEDCNLNIHCNVPNLT
jgi:hypothetical protein